MKIQKILNHIINVDSKEMFSADLDEVVRNKLIVSLQGKCYMGMFIVEILDIKTRTQCSIERSRTGNGKVSVSCTINAIMYDAGDVIICEIRNVDSKGWLICESEYAYGIVNEHSLLKELKRTQWIPVKVGKIKYPLNKQKTTINGRPYTTNTTNNIFKIDKLTDDEHAYFQPLIKTITEEREKITKFDKALVKFFTDLFYPHKKTISPPKGEKIKSLTSLDFSGYVCRPSSTEVTSLNIIEYAKTPDTYIEETGKIVVYNFLRQLYNELILISGMCEKYKTMTTVKANQNVWDLFTSIKK
jgi:DNA-directed RNA polymerase subunit E'/Rpb7